MRTLRILGEAPSRRGDGRAFTGPSGNRLASLLGIDAESLQRQPQIELLNLFPSPVQKLEPDRGDPFDKGLARTNAATLLSVWKEDPQPVLACGHRVYRALMGQRGILFQGRRVRGVDVWLFPHPSGASPYWNDPDRVRHASTFLRRIRKRYGIAIE